MTMTTKEALEELNPLGDEKLQAQNAKDGAVSHINPVASHITRPGPRTDLRKALVAGLIGIFLASVLAGRVGEDDHTPKVGDYRTYEGQLMVDGSPSKIVKTFGMTTRIEEPEEINGKEYIKTATYASDPPEGESQVYYSRWTKDTIFILAEDRVSELEQPRKYFIGQTFKSSQGLACTVEAKEDLLLEKMTFKDTWKTSCSGHGISTTIFFANDGYELKNGNVIDITLVEQGNVYAPE